MIASMPDIVLFRVRNQPLVTLHTLYAKWVVSLFALFMVGGNFFRFFAIAPFGNHLSIVELLFYGSCLPAYFLHLRKSLLLLVGIALSTLYGVILNGFDLVSVMYSCKLMAMIISGVVLGELITKEQMLRIFTYVLIIGGLIFFLFPKAHLFFQLLEGYGVRFIGDPHERRFISPFLDPNYYGAIACIPLILSYHLKKKGLFLLFLTSILLTFSRSGITTATFLSMGFLLAHRWKIRVKISSMVTFLGLVGVSLFYSRDIGCLIERTLHFLEDPSALSRFESIKTGLSYFILRPFFGVGHNYVSFLFTEDLQTHVLDSSLLFILINFGLIPTLAFAAYGLFWTLQHIQRGVFGWLYIYLLICILFTSLFNHLLFFPYWLIPMVGLFTHLVKSENRVRP